MLLCDVLQPSQQIVGVAHHQASGAVGQSKQNLLAAGAGIRKGRAESVRIALRPAAGASPSLHHVRVTIGGQRRHVARIGLIENGPHIHRIEGDAGLIRSVDSIPHFRFRIAVWTKASQ